MQPPLNLVWEHLLPAMRPEPLPVDEAAHAALAEQLAGLRLSPPQGQPVPDLAATISGRTYAIAPNMLGVEAISFQFTASGCDVSIRNGQGAHQIAVGDGTWRRGLTTFSERPGEHPVAAAGAWIGPDSYRLVVYYTATPFCISATFRFEGERLLVREFAQNVSFGPTAFPDLEG
jgi:hypothetical protein